MMSLPWFHRLLQSLHSLTKKQRRTSDDLNEVWFHMPKKLVAEKHQYIFHILEKKTRGEILQEEFDKLEGLWWFSILTLTFWLSCYSLWQWYNTMDKSSSSPSTFRSMLCIIMLWLLVAFMALSTHWCWNALIVKTSSAERALGRWWYVVSLFTFSTTHGELSGGKKKDHKDHSFQTAKTQNKKQKLNNLSPQTISKNCFFQVCEKKSEYRFYSEKIADRLSS